MIGKGNDCLFPLYVGVPGYESVKLRARCGHCINCKIHRSREWSMRLEMESKYWSDMCFVTLTYNDENLPINVIDGRLFFNEDELQKHPEYRYFHYPTHRPSDLRNFIKRLRKQLEHKIRYFAVGEYGTRYGRSHLHLLLFGVPYNRESLRLIEKCWPFGFVKMTMAFPETCSYVAGYVQKKLYGKNKDFFRLPEFMRCSQHLGENWLYDHLSLFDDKHFTISWHGYDYGIPRQFRKILYKLGVLKETSMLGCALIQKDEYIELSKHLKSTGISESDFFRGRVNEAIEKEKRKNHRRDITGDI